MQGQLPPPRQLVFWAVVFEGGLGVLAIALGWWLGCPTIEAVRWSVPAVIGGSLAGLPMLVLFLGTARLRIWPFFDVVRVVDELLVPLFRDCRVVHLALISALAGWGEELLFRGVIQEAVAGWVPGPWGIWVGLAAAAILFGLAHPITPGYVLLAGLMGLYLGWLQIVCGNLLVPIMAHAVYDFLALVYLVRIRPPGATSPAEELPTRE